MSERAALTQLWFMDWFGHVIDHDPVRDDMIRVPFKAGVYPDLYALASLPLSLPCTAVLRKRISLPRALPDFDIVDAREGLVGFRVKDRNTWLSVHPHNDQTHCDSAALLDWERFLPLTRTMMRGLSALAERTIAEVTDEQGQACPGLVFLSDNLRELGGFRFVLGINAGALQEIGALSPGSQARITLTGEDGHTPRDFFFRMKA